MRHHHRVLLALALLSPWAAADASADAPPPTAVVADAPALVPADGSPFAADVRVTGPPGADVDVRVTVLSGSAALARAWTGAAWAPATRYQLAVTLDDAGSWRGAVALALAEPAPAGAAVRVAARARLAGTADAGPWHHRDAFLATPAYAAALPALGVGDLAWIVAPDGTPLGSATATGVGVPLVVAPAGEDLRLVTPNGTGPAPPLPAARLARIAPAEDTVRIQHAVPGLCARVGHAEACLHDAAPATTLPMTVPDAGGNVTLHLGPVLLDAVEYPRLARDAEWARGEDGTWAEVKPGRTAFATRDFRVREVTPLVLPRDGYTAAVAIVAGANHTLDVATFTLESPALARHLADAAARGVTVRVLLDGSPPGGVAPEERRLVAALAAAGVGVRAGGPQFAAHHAKVAVADGERVLVSSENWNPASYPADPTEDARRGWGVMVRDAALAMHLTRVLDADWTTARPYGLADATPPPLPPAPPPASDLPRSVAAAGVRVILAPDDAVAPVTALLAGATRTLDVQQLRAQGAWGAEENAFLAGVVDAARRGVRVRILLDGSLDDADNRLVVDRLHALAARENVTLEARLAAPHRLVHNKGVLVDGRLALVGSLNWVRAAVQDNREVALLVDSPAAAAAFGRAFDADWADAAPPPADPAPRERGVPATGAVGGALALALSAASSPSSSTRRNRRRRAPRTRRTRRRS